MFLKYNSFCLFLFHSPLYAVSFKISYKRECNIFLFYIWWIIVGVSIFDGTDKEDDSLCCWSSSQRLKSFSLVFLTGRMLLEESYFILQLLHFALVGDTLDCCECKQCPDRDFVKSECFIGGFIGTHNRVIPFSGTNNRVIPFVNFSDWIENVFCFHLLILLLIINLLLYF